MDFHLPPAHKFTIQANPIVLMFIKLMAPVRGRFRPKSRQKPKWPKFLKKRYLTAITCLSGVAKSIIKTRNQQSFNNPVTNRPGRGQDRHDKPVEPLRLKYGGKHETDP
jgi:hypothetical protein